MNSFLVVLSLSKVLALAGVMKPERNGMTASIPGKWQLLTVIDMCGNGFGYLPGVAILDGY